MSTPPAQNKRHASRRGAAIAAAAGTLGFTGAILAAGLGGTGTASADALCDQMRAQYGPSWPCISVPTYTPPPTMPTGPTTPNAPGAPSGDGPVIGGDAGPGPGQGNGTPIIGGTETPNRPNNTQAPNAPTTQTPGTTTRSPTPGQREQPGRQNIEEHPGRTRAPADTPVGHPTPHTTEEALLSPASDDEPTIPLPVWAVAGAAAIVAASPRSRSLLKRGGSTRATIGPSRMVLMHDESSPTRYRFAMNVPDGGYTKVNPDGSATVYDKDGNPIRSVARPWAFDAAGRPQKTWYTVDENGDLVQHIEPADNALFPILADPMDMSGAGGTVHGAGASVGPDSQVPVEQRDSDVAGVLAPIVDGPPSGGNGLDLPEQGPDTVPTQPAPAPSSQARVPNAFGVGEPEADAPATTSPAPGDNGVADTLRPLVEGPPPNNEVDPQAPDAQSDEPQVPLPFDIRDKGQPTTEQASGDNGVADTLQPLVQGTPTTDEPSDEAAAILPFNILDKGQPEATGPADMGPLGEQGSTVQWNNDGTGTITAPDGEQFPVQRSLDAAGNPVIASIDPDTGNKTVISTGPVESVGGYDGQIAEVFDSEGNLLLREESFSGGTLADGSSAGTTIRQVDYLTGKQLILNYDAQGNLYNSAYSDQDVNVLLTPDGSLNATLINPDADYDWNQIAQAVPQDFAANSDGQPVVINKGDEQLTLNPDGSSTLADFDTDRALHFAPGETDPNTITHADGSDLSVGDGMHDFGQGAWDGARSLIGVGPDGTWETWKGLGNGLGTVIMYLPNSMSDGMHGAANMGNPTGYQHPNREGALFQALTGVNPELLRTSPGYATGMLAGAGLTAAIPGGAGVLGKALRPTVRTGHGVTRSPIGEAIAPALRNHGYTHGQFQQLMIQPTRPLTPDEIAKLPPGTLVPQPLNRMESAVVDSARSAIPPLTPNTPLQKALDPTGGQLANILNNHTPNQRRFPLDGVGGSVAALDDVIALATPRDLFNGLALHYPGTGHQLDNAFVLRFTTPDVGIVPNGPLLNDLLTPGGLHSGEGFTPPPGKSTYPFTGHGFTGSRGHIIPEYELNMAIMDAGATLVRIAEDGSETIIRALTDAGQWVNP